MDKPRLVLFSLLFCLCSFFAFGEKNQYPKGVQKIDEVEIAGVSYDIVTFGKFPQSKDSQTGQYITEPIKWRVAQKKNGKAFLICENELMANVPVFEHFSDSRVIEGKIVYPNNYKYSEVRAYLNGLSFPDLKDENFKWDGKGFLQSAFNEEEQKLILVTTVNNRVSGNKYACENTEDKIFLLSIEEVFNPDLGFVNDESRIRPATEYSEANMAFRSGKSPHGGIWWLRTPQADYLSRTFVVLYTGEAGDKTNRTRDPITGIVPTMWITLK